MMALKGYLILWLKIQAARWLRITSKLSDAELDMMLTACEGEPALRPTMEDLLLPDVSM